MGRIEIPLEVGQKVILSNGITGRIIEVNDDKEQFRFSYDPIYADTYGYDGKLIRKMSYAESDLEPFYLLGKNLIGNKVDPKVIEREIADYRYELDALHRTVRCLRRQLFQLNVNMVEKDRPSETALNCVLSNESEKTDE